MQFVYPGFLIGLLALAIPVVIHLFNFRRYKKVWFSNVQFLKNIGLKQATGKNLKKRLLLLSRLLALAFLVLAFAKPYIPNGKVQAGRQQVVSVFVDNSYSMLNLNREGTLFDDARAKAKDIALAYGLNTRFQLLSHDFEGAQQRLLNRDEFLAAVDKLTPGAQGRTLGQIIARQQSMLNVQAGAAKTAYIVSDFQTNLLTQGPIKPDSGISLNFIKLKTQLLPNLAIDSVWMLSAVHRPNEAEKLVLRLHNYSDEAAQKVPLKLRINNVQKALASYTLKAREVQTDTLSCSGLVAGWQQAQIDLQDNPVTFDNRFCFAFEVKAQMPILLIGNNTPNKYLNAVYHADTFFRVDNVTQGAVNYTGLPAYPLIVLSDVAALPTGLVQQLQQYVNNGGTLVFFPDDGAAAPDLNSYRQLLQPLNAAWPNALVNAPAKVIDANWQSPVFKNTFEQTPQNPDLPSAIKYYHLQAPANAAGETLFGLPGKNIFFGGYSAGKGQVYVSAVPLNAAYSNLQQHALFVPLMLRMALLSGSSQSLYYTIGSNEITQSPAIHIGDAEPLKLYRDSDVLIPDVRQANGKQLLYFADEVNQPGIYKLKMRDSLVAVLAFNSSRSESDLSYCTDAQLKAAAGNANIMSGAQNMPISTQIAKANNGTELWKLCIILALFCIAAEIVLLKFYKPKNKVAL